MYKKGNSARWIILVLIIIVLSLAIYFTWFFYPKCSDMECYVSHQEACKKAKFVNEGSEKVWYYEVNGKEGNKCEINVEFLEIRKGDIQLKVLEGKKMVCLLPYGSQRNPELDLLKCKGELREEIQNQIIQKLHSYIVENVGEIGEELAKI